MPPEGSLETTTSIGGRYKVRKDFSRPVLISREAWPVIFTNVLQLRSQRFISVVIAFGVAMAEGLHLFPFRTEKLSPPAPMVLPGKPGGRVGRRPSFFESPGFTPGLSAFLDESGGAVHDAVAAGGHWRRSAPYWEVQLGTALIRSVARSSRQLIVPERLAPPVEIVRRSARRLLK